MGYCGSIGGLPNHRKKKTLDLAKKKTLDLAKKRPWILPKKKDEKTKPNK